MTSEFPLISIITPLLNGEKTIEQCLASVANQTYPHKEHWIIDGLSTDNSLAIVQKWANKYPHIHYISQKDNGIYEAMNKGIDFSHGEWLYFMGCDDILADDYVLNNIMSKKQNAHLLVGKIILMGLHKQIVRTPSVSFKRFLYNTLPHQSCFYHSSLFFTLKYDESLEIAADYKLNLQLLKRHINYQILDIVIAKHSLDGISNKRIHKQLKEFNEIRKQLLPKPVATIINGIATTNFWVMQGLKKLLPEVIINKIQVFKQKYLMQ